MYVKTTGLAGPGLASRFLIQEARKMDIRRPIKAGQETTPKICLTHAISRQINCEFGLPWKLMFTY